MTTSSSGRPTRAQAIDNAGRKLALQDAAIAQMTPREQAEAAWTPTSPYTKAQLEERIRARRGMPPLHDASAVRDRAESA